MIQIRFESYFFLFASPALQNFFFFFFSPNRYCLDSAYFQGFLMAFSRTELIAAPVFLTSRI